MHEGSSIGLPYFIMRSQRAADDLLHRWRSLRLLGSASSAVHVLPGRKLAERMYRLVCQVWEPLLSSNLAAQTHQLGRRRPADVGRHGGPPQGRVHLVNVGRESLQQEGSR
jgi:hypothetical protein